MEKYHIGQEILKEVKAKYPTIKAFSDALCKSPSATYEIFKKTSLDTDLLLSVSKVLGRDFFKEFSEKCLNGEVAVDDKAEEFNMSCLLPEEKLHIILPTRLEDTLEEYFLGQRKKPLVIFYDQKTIPVHEYIRTIGENSYGNGMIKEMQVSKNDLADFDSQIPSLTKLPQKIILVYFTSFGFNSKFDDMILLTEKLLTESGKYVVVLCDCRNSVELRNGRPDYISYAETALDTWHSRIHAFVADNANKDYTHNKELYLVAKGKGYIDWICYLLNQDKDEYEKEARQLIAEAKQELGTFKDTVIEEGENFTRHQISTIQLRSSEEKRIAGSLNIPKTEMWYQVDKKTGRITEWQYDKRNQLSELILKD